MAKRLPKRRGRVPLKTKLRDTSHTEEARQLELIRSGIDRRRKRMEQDLAKIKELDGSKYTINMLENQINKLTEARANYTVKNLTSYVDESGKTKHYKRTGAEAKKYFQVIDAAIKEGRSTYIEDLSYKSNQNFAGQDIAARMHMKQATAIMQYTYGKRIWTSGDSRSERWEKMRQYVADNKRDANGNLKFDGDASLVRDYDVLEYFNREVADELGFNYMDEDDAFMAVEQSYVIPTYQDEMYKLLSQLFGWGA